MQAALVRALGAHHGGGVVYLDIPVRDDFAGAKEKSLAPAQDGMDVPLPLIRHLIALYAEGAAEIVRLVHERPELAQPLCAGSDTIQAEVVYTIRREMAVRLSDVLVRRTGLGSASAPPDEAVRAAARIAQAECSWDEERTAREIAEVERFYSVR